MESGARIGLFGGSFNPVHTGHLRAAEEMREHFSLDQVVFIPAHISPHKPAATRDSARHRMIMLEQLIEGLQHKGAEFATLEEAAREFDGRSPFTAG
jgi:nicotinate-nucleotide adenylyltransferase